MLRLPIRGLYAYEIVAKRNHRPSFGSYGTILYWYQSGLERPDQAGMLSHPVDSKEDAEYWLDFYRNDTLTVEGKTEMQYRNAYFIPYQERAC